MTEGYWLGLAENKVMIKTLLEKKLTQSINRGEPAVECSLLIETCSILISRSVSGAIATM